MSKGANYADSLFGVGALSIRGLAFRTLHLIDTCLFAANLYYSPTRIVLMQVLDGEEEEIAPTDKLRNRHVENQPGARNSSASRMRNG
jgi:hypothetical protein